MAGSAAGTYHGDRQSANAGLPQSAHITPTYDEVVAQYARSRELLGLPPDAITEAHPFRGPCPYEGETQTGEGCHRRESSRSREHRAGRHSTRRDHDPGRGWRPSRSRSRSRERRQVKSSDTGLIFDESTKLTVARLYNTGALANPSKRVPTAAIERHRATMEAAADVRVPGGGGDSTGQDCGRGNNQISPMAIVPSVSGQLKFVDASQVVDGPPLSFEETRETIRVAISLGGPSVNDVHLSNLNIQLLAIISLLPLRGHVRTESAGGLAGAGWYSNPIHRSLRL